MSVFLWLVIVWGTGLAGVIAAGFGIAIVNVEIMTKIQGTPLETRLRQTRRSQRLAVLDMLGYRALDADAAVIAGERTLPTDVVKDLRTLRWLEFAMFCALLPCAGVLVACWIVAAR